jgi:NhaA family Na+:H+ antiporter
MSREEAATGLRLLVPLNRARDHVRGGEKGEVVVVGYQDFLCPYCRRLRDVFYRLRGALGDRLTYVFRHFPNERAHPGAELVARASEAAARQGRFWEMHDRLFDHELPITRADTIRIARELGLELPRFERDLESDEVRARVQEDLASGRRNGVTGTPTLFVDGVRYDGAWDFYSMLEALERPVAARMQRSARVFASLPASAGLVLLLSALIAIVLANTPARPVYEAIMNARVGFVGPSHSMLSLSVRGWFSEGLLAFFFLLVGLEIRREMTLGALTDRRAALLPAVAALGGVVVPALLYLAFNHHGGAVSGWSIPTATDMAFTLGVLAVLGPRVPTGLRAFVAALAVVDDILSMLTLAIFYPRSFQPVFLAPVALAVLALFALNRARVYAIWPYAIVSLALWTSLHSLGVHAALAGVVVALCLPTRPPPTPAPLLAQAATTLATLEHAEAEAQRGDGDEPRADRETVWDWAARNLSAASARMLSPADRVERAVAPWSAFVVLPLFALSATGVSIALDLASPDATPVFAGVLVGLVIGKPLGVLLASGLAVATRAAIAPEGVGLRHFVGAAFLCGVADTMSLLMTDRAFAADDPKADVAKVAVLIGSAVAGALGALVLRSSGPARTRAP